MQWLPLNIMGTEWIIVIFVALVLILGTGKLPAVAKKLGRAAAEFEKAKDDIRHQISPEMNVRPDGPVKSERQKLEAMAKSVGIDPAEMPTDQLRRAVRDKLGGPS